MISHPIPIEVLRQLLRLDPETGRLFWLPRAAEWFKDPAYASRWNTRYAYTEALAAKHNAGYRCGRIFDRLYLAHIVVFALHHGHWPENEIDHEDRNRSNNVPSNLIDATHRENLLNGARRVHGSSLYRGVSWSRLHLQWVSSVKGAYPRRTIILGLFDDERKAAAAYDAAAKRMHGRHARPNFPAAG